MLNHAGRDVKPEGRFEQLLLSQEPVVSLSSPTSGLSKLGYNKRTLQGKIKLDTHTQK